MTEEVGGIISGTIPRWGSMWMMLILGLLVGIAVVISLKEKRPLFFAIRTFNFIAIFGLAGFIAALSSPVDASNYSAENVLVGKQTVSSVQSCDIDGTAPAEWKDDSGQWWSGVISTKSGWGRCVVSLSGGNEISTPDSALVSLN